MTTSNIETEVRSFISPKQHRELLKFFKKKGKFLGRERNRRLLLAKLAELGVELTPKAEFDKKFGYYKRNWRKLI